MPTSVIDTMMGAGDMQEHEIVELKKTTYWIDLVISYVLGVVMTLCCLGCHLSAHRARKKQEGIRGVFANQTIAGEGNKIMAEGVVGGTTDILVGTKDAAVELVTDPLQFAKDAKDDLVFEVEHLEAAISDTLGQKK
jgi:hypothetical protein